jgi:molybdopterin molybdotransferase
VVTSLTAREAAIRIQSAVPVGPPLRVPLASALGSVLAEPVVSPIDVPFWANSAMDGYAVRAVDVRGAGPAAPVRLQVIEQIPAGAFPTRSVGAGQAARIFTGAPLPKGADSVVRQEDTDLGSDLVTIVRDRDCGVNVRHAGEDLKAGALVFEAGTALGPAHLGVLASLAMAHPVVYRRPRVAIIGSGDEIVDVDQPDLILSGRKVASSNRHTMAAVVRLAGGEPVSLGNAADRPEAIRRRLESALDCDLIVTTAGISVGEHDFLRGVLTSMGAEIDFWKLRMRPGAPVGFGMVGSVPWIGLPGNPVSALVTFELFARPAIRRMMGEPLPFRRTVRIAPAEPIRLGPTLQHFLRARITGDGPQAVASLTGPQGSGILTSMATANALLIVPEGIQSVEAGSPVDAIRLDDPTHLAFPPF